MLIGGIALEITINHKNWFTEKKDPSEAKLWKVPAIRLLMIEGCFIGLGWGFFDCNNMPILCQIARPGLRATGYGIMNLVSISVGGFADIGFGMLRDRNVPLNAIFGTFALAAMISVVLVLLIKPSEQVETRG